MIRSLKDEGVRVPDGLEAGSLKTYSLKEKGKEIISGLSIGDAIAV
ncbi:MAG: hypothetical protein RID09_02960 [Coleofasciculus sp. G1-WW12-02]